MTLSVTTVRIKGLYVTNGRNKLECLLFVSKSIKKHTPDLLTNITRMKRLARDKHSSSLQTFVTYKHFMQNVVMLSVIMWTLVALYFKNKHSDTPVYGRVGWPNPATLG